MIVSGGYSDPRNSLREKLVHKTIALGRLYYF